MSINNKGPQFSGSNLGQWAWQVRLPWIVETFGLTAGVLCGTLSESLRRKAYGLGETDVLPAPIDWRRNNILVSPPATGKGMALIPEALSVYDRVVMLVPSVIQAHKLEESLDALYHKKLAGCITSQRQSKGLVEIVTTGIFAALVRDRSSRLWDPQTCLVIDEAQRILEGDDAATEMLVGYAAACGVKTNIISATIDPAGLDR